MQVAKYFSSIGFQIDKRSITEVQRTFANIEARMSAFSRKMSKGLNLNFNISNFSVDQRRLNRTMGDALDIASTRTTFEISRFAVNDRNLQATLMRAGHRASSVLNRAPLSGPASHPARRAVRAGGSFIGGASRLIGPAVALGLGGYGISQLNKRNQQVVSAQLQSQAVVQQAGGTAGEGQASFDWLRKEGNRVGFNYLDASGDYNKLLSGLTGAGMSVKQGQGVFKGFSELSRVNKLDRTAQSRVYRALSQVAGKNKLQSEELTGQLAESLPGAVSIFARAYQAKLAAEGKGGGKVGQEAISELLAAMKKGLVKGDILPYAGQIASEQAAPGLAKASTASQAEEGRMQNVVSDLSIVASNSGVEEGFARIFKTLSTGLEESTGLVRNLAQGFNEATIWTSKLLLFPQSFIRALDGRDSLVSDWLGAEQTKELQSDWSEIASSFKEIWSLGEPSWMPSLKDVAQVMKDAVGIAGGISQKVRETSSVAGQIYDQDGPLSAAGYLANSAGQGLRIGTGKALNKVMDTIPGGRNIPFTDIPNPLTFIPRYLGDALAAPGTDLYAKYYIEQMQKNGQDTSMYGPNGEGWRETNQQGNQLLAPRVFGPNGYNPSESSAAAFQSAADAYKQGSSQATNQNKFDVSVVINAPDAGSIKDEVESYFSYKWKSDIDTAMMHFEQK